MENKEKELPRKEFRVTDDEGNVIGDLSMISIVTDPAIEMSFQYFNKQKLVKSNFKVSSEERMEITGPVMIPNKDIIRKDEATGTFFNCYFSEETVRKCMEIYMENCNHIRANFEHATGPISGLFVSQSWIVENPEMDKSKALGFEGVTKGDWFATYKVKSKEAWEIIKNSDFTGFSVEGNFAFNKLKKQDFTEAEIESAIDSIIDVNPNTNVKSKYTLLYNLIKDIVFTEGMDEEARYKLVRKLLNKI